MNQQLQDEIERIKYEYREKTASSYKMMKDRAIEVGKFLIDHKSGVNWNWETLSIDHDIQCSGDKYFEVSPYTNLIIDFDQEEEIVRIYHQEVYHDREKSWFLRFPMSYLWTNDWQDQVLKEEQEYKQQKQQEIEEKEKQQLEFLLRKYKDEK